MAEKYAPHVEHLRAVAASPSRRLVAIGGERDVRRDQAHGAGTQVHVMTLPKVKPASVAAVDGAVHALVFASDALLLAGLSTGAIIGWDTSAAGTETAASLPRALHEDRAHAGTVRGLAAATQGNAVILASVGDDGVLRVARIDTGAGRIALVAERTLSSRPLRVVAIDAQGRTVAAAGDDGVIRAVPVADAARAALREMPCGEGGIGALCFTGDGRIAAGCGDGSIQLCYLEGAVDAEDRAREAAHTSMVRGAIMSAELQDDAGRPLPRRLFSIAEDGTLKSWLLDTRRRPRTISLGSARLTSMAHVAAGRGAKPERRGGTLIVVDDERRIHLVDVSEQAEPSEAVRRVGSALDRLAAALDASSVKVRIDALDALGALAEDDAGALLERGLERDSKAEARKRAAEVLGRSGRRKSRPALRRALADSDTSVRRAVLDALTRIEADAPLAPVRAALDAPHADIRIAALERLPGLRAESPLVPGLVAAGLADSAETVRRAALDALHALAGADPVEPARIAMQRGPADIRAEALLRLGRARKTGEPAASTLLEAALDDDSADVRKQALLISIGARQRLAARVRAVDADIRKALDALEAGGRLAEPWPAREAAPPLTDEDLSPLFSALTCRHADTALSAARCLGALSDARATGALLQLSREADVEVRRAAVAALARAAMSMPADTRITARLGWLIDDDDPMVRAAAFDALAELGAPDGATAVLDLAALALSSSREDIRLRALPILVEFGGRGRHAGVRELSGRAGELLGQALDDEHGKVRIEAFGTLWAWYAGQPRAPLTLGAACRHADIRKRVVDELARIADRAPGHWADDLLLSLIGDGAADVGLAAYQVLTGKRDEKAGKKKQAGKSAERVEVHRAALDAPRPEVRAAGCKGAPLAASEALRARLVELVADLQPEVHLAAIEAIDRLVPGDAEGFALAFGSELYELRVRAAELCGKRRDRRAVAPARKLLEIPPHHFNRPTPVIRQRAARALADVGDRDAIPFLVSLLEDEDALVREMAARGLATSCRPGDEKPLADALSHPDLPVRSWVAEGLARLGDERALPVLAGTLAHDHKPMRLGAIMGFVALGPDGVRGILQGLDDPIRDIQDLVFAVIVARDVALARAGEPPDLLLSALSSSSPEIRLGAARILEARMAGEDLGQVAQELVGPRKPDKAADMKDWPDEGERWRRLDTLIAALASEHPAQRYAAAQVLSLRGQALAFWREAGRLMGPSAASRPRIPYTSWEDDEAFQPRKKGWIRSLIARGPGNAPDGVAPASATERVLTVLKFAGAPEGRAVPPARAGFDEADARKLVFGVYAGLIRQAPARGEADETHRVRRDSIDRLAVLAAGVAVGRDAVLPVLRRALSDPHHLVRKAATAALRSLYPGGSLAPLRLALEATAADVGRAAVDELVAASLAGDQDAVALARSAIDAPAPEVRAHALSQLPRLFEPGSLEPWLVALDGRHADVRLSVVDRLLAGVESAAGSALGEGTQARVSQALGRAMESDHEDLRIKAAVALAGRGDARTVDVLAGMLRSEEEDTARRATEALVALAHARPRAAEADAIAADAARAVAARLEDDPDGTADRKALIDALGRIGSPTGGDALLALLDDEDAELRSRALSTLLVIARRRDDLRRLLPARPVRGADVRREHYDEAVALGYLAEAAARSSARLRGQAARALRDIDDRGAEALLARLVEDREEAVRVAACESLAFRAEHVEGASMDALAGALRGGRRELVLPAAAGMASRGRPEAFQALLLVLKAGEQAERERAVLALGKLGDRRALAELEPLIAGGTELPPEDAALAPAAAESLGRMLPRLRDDDPAHPGEQRRVREVVEHLVREGSRELRKRAITGLRHAASASEDARSRALLERIVADAHDDTDVRVHATRELGALGHAGAEGVLADALDEDAPQLRRAAMDALDRIFPRRRIDDRTRTSLLALRSRHQDISAPAAAFLASQGDPAVLVGRLDRIENDEIRERLRRGLVRRGACPVDELVAVLAAEHPGARADAAWIAGAAAGRERDARARDVLRAAVVQAVERAAADWRVAREIPGSAGAGASEAGARLARAEDAWCACLWAAQRLGAEAGAAARHALVRGSGHASEAGPGAGAVISAPASVRREALRFLGSHGSASDLDLVGPMLSDADASVRAAAAAAWVALAPERARAAIEEPGVADAVALAPVAVAALAGDDRGRDLLDTASSRRVVLPVMLGRKRTETLIAVARAGGKDPARLVAIAALGRVGDHEAEDALGAIFRDDAEESAVRAAAFRALRRLQRRAARAVRFREEEQR